MKKKTVITLIALVVALFFAIYSVVLWDMARKHSPSAEPSIPIAAQPASDAQVQNLQAPLPAAPVAVENVNDVKALVAKLANPDPNVQARAQLALEKIGQPALAEIQDARLTHPDPEVRARCNELVIVLLGTPEVNQRLAGGGGQIIERKASIGLDGRMQAEEIVKDMAGNILQRRVIETAPAPNAAPRRQRDAFAQLEAMRAEREARERVLGGGNDLRHQLQQQQDLLAQRRRANTDQMKQLQQAAPPPKAEEFSMNMLNTFGARLAETADGLRVIEVKPDSPAGRAGLAVGDLITRLNGRQTATEDDFKAALARTKGETEPLHFDVTRRGEDLTLEISRPSPSHDCRLTFP